MKKNIIALALLAFALLAMAKTYKLVYEEYPPYEYKVNGKLTGMDVEILEEAAKTAGVSLEFKEYPWARATKMAEEGEVDAIFSMSKTADREKLFYFPSVYLSGETNVIFANDAFKGEIKSITDLKGKRIGVVADYSYGVEFDGYKDCKKEINSNQETLMKKLKENRFQLAINNQLVGNHKAKELGATNIRVLSYIASNDPLFLGVSKKSASGKEFFDLMNKTLSDMDKAGKLKPIRDKYTK